MSDKVRVNTLQFSHEQKLENIQKKIDELNKMLKRINKVNLIPECFLRIEII